MKKVILVLGILCLLGLPSLAAEEKQDMVVLFDTSVSVLPVYDILADYLVKGLVQEQLREGDSFHLLSFADEPVYEFSQNMKGKTEEDRIISYVSVLKPMGQYTDLISAMNYLYRFTKDLSLNSRKVILILTDGIHDPPPGSALYGKDRAFVENSLAEISRKIFREGWEVHLLDVPSLMDGDSETGGFTDLLSRELGVDPVSFEEGKSDFSHRVMQNPRLSVKTDAGDVDYRFDLELEISNYGEEPLVATLQEILWKNQNILKDKVPFNIAAGQTRGGRASVQLPPDTQPGAMELDLRFVFTDGSRITPDRVKISLNLVYDKRRYNGGSFPAVWIIAALAALVILVLLILFIRRKVMTPVFSEEKPRRGVSRLAGEEDEEEPSVRDGREGSWDSGVYTPAGTAAGKNAGGTAGRERSAAADSRIGREDTVSLSSPEKKDYSDLKRPQSDYTVLAGADRKKEPEVLKLKSEKEKQERSPRDMADRPSKNVRIRKEEIRLAVEMHVTGQNPYQGTRNISVIREGETKLVGGRSCPYTVFIISIHKPIAEIHYDGSRYTLKPLIAEAFPDLSGELKDCLDRYITIRDEAGRRTQIRFSRWVSPLERINKIMHLVDKPGLPDFRY